MNCGLIHLVDFIGVLDNILVVITQVLRVGGKLRKKSELLAVRRILERFYLLEIGNWKLYVIERRLKVLDHKSQIDQVSEFNITFVHSELVSNSVRIGSFRGLEGPKELILDTSASVADVTLNNLYFLNSKGQDLLFNDVADDLLCNHPIVGCKRSAPWHLLVVVSEVKFNKRLPDILLNQVLRILRIISRHFDLIGLILKLSTEGLLAAKESIFVASIVQDKDKLLDGCG